MPRKNKATVKCAVCGETHEVETNLLTGWRYSPGWVIRCPRCGGKTEEVKNGH
jgi:transcription elongation factor Elf1